MSATKLFRFCYAAGPAAVNPRNVLAIYQGRFGSGNPAVVCVDVDSSDGRVIFSDAVGTVDELADRLEACLSGQPTPRERQPSEVIDGIRPAMAQARERGWTQKEIDAVILRLCPKGIHYLTDDEIAELLRAIKGAP